MTEGWVLPDLITLVVGILGYQVLPDLSKERFYNQHPMPKETKTEKTAWKPRVEIMVLRMGSAMRLDPMKSKGEFHD